MRVERLGSFRFGRCDGCSHRFVDATSVDRAEVERHYDASYRGFRHDEVFAARVREEIDRRIAPLLSPGAPILDVGCGNGEFMTAARDAGFAPIGLDLSSDAVAGCRERGLDARAGDFLALELPVDFALVTFWDVVEHLFEPLSFLRRAHECLRPGGYLLVKVPGHGELGLRAASAVPWLTRSLLQMPAHLQFFTRESLTRALGEAGFDQLRWAPKVALRGQARGGSLKRRASRLALRGITKLSRDGNLYVIARKR